MTAPLQMSLLAPRFTGGTAAPVPRVYEDPFTRYIAPALDAAGDAPLKFDNASWDHAARDAVGVDVESYVNFFVVCFLRFSDGKRLAYESSDRVKFNAAAVEYVLRKNLIVSFNGNAYDLPMLKAALADPSPARLKAYSDALIRGSERFPLGLPGLNHIDLLEPNPAIRQGLKMIHGRLHGRFVVDLPYPPGARLTPRAMNVTTLYCMNDLDANATLFGALREPLALREALGREYRLDLRSKSDAQVGEALVKREVERALRRRVAPAPAPATFTYTVPEFVRFEDPFLKSLTNALRTTVFAVNGAGHPEMPPLLDKLVVELYGNVYAMGIGGLHSTEAHRALYASEDRLLIDVDVASQYPNIILKLGLYPGGIGPEFLKVYGRIVATRLEAKAKMLELDKTRHEDPALKAEYDRYKVRADGGRIQANGVYGKLGSSFSALYAPHMLIATTLTGQLSILMLIEAAGKRGIEVVSANTDGVVFFPRKGQLAALDGVLAEWENVTGFQTERTEYTALLNASVNTYFALKANGRVKRKGTIADPRREGDLRGQMMKNPAATICGEAVLRYVVDGTAIEKTVRETTDPRDFLTLVKVTNGAAWRGHPLGRAVRYYWATDGAPITTLDGKRKISDTDGAWPLVELTEEMPPNVDYLRYCEEAVKLGNELGIRVK